MSSRRSEQASSKRTDGAAAGDREAARRDGAPGEAARLVELDIIPDATGGILGVAEMTRHIGFPVRRVYFLDRIKQGGRRGAHAHRRLKQCFICLRGAVTIDVEKGGERASFRLDDCATALLLPPGYWRDLRDFTGDALLAVLASEEYDEGDYIRDYAAFRAFEARQADAVPYIDFRRYCDALESDLDEALWAVVRSGMFIGGERLDAFERAFATYCGAAHAVGVGTGLDALMLALRARSIGPGDEVIVPANTFPGTAIAVSQVGAVPVLVDCAEDTGLIDVDQVPAALTARTRAIIPVHLYGHPADMDALRAAAGKHDLLVLEDACQAHGARYKGRRCGALGDAAAFSFYPTKNLGAFGDGGAVVTSDATLAGAVRQLANYGCSAKYHHGVIGTNSRLDPIQAAVLSAKLPHIDRWHARRRALAARYLEGLAGIDGLALPGSRAWAEPVWHAFVVRVAGGRRADLQAALAAAGIGSNIHYPVPVHRQQCYADRGWREGQFPVAERRADEVLSLPLDAMHADHEIDRVVERVREFFRAGRPAVC
jgi:dTDP-3-amino-3,4,6-trideoxy-alpha-D-glucose transaminase